MSLWELRVKRGLSTLGVPNKQIDVQMRVMSLMIESATSALRDSFYPRIVPSIDCVAILVLLCFLGLHFSFDSGITLELQLTLKPL